MIFGHDFQGAIASHLNLNFTGNLLKLSPTPLPLLFILAIINFSTIDLRRLTRPRQAHAHSKLLACLLPLACFPRPRQHQSSQGKEQGRLGAWALFSVRAVWERRPEGPSYPPLPCKAPLSCQLPAFLFLQHTTPLSDPMGEGRYVCW